MVEAEHHIAAKSAQTYHSVVGAARYLLFGFGYHGGFGVAFFPLGYLVDKLSRRGPEVIHFAYVFAVLGLH